MQLGALGYTQKQIQWLVRRGILNPLYPGSLPLGIEGVTAFDELIRDTGIPGPQRNVHVGGWELDRYWPEFTLAVELDGRNYHTAVRDTERTGTRTPSWCCSGSARSASPSSDSSSSPAGSWPTCEG